MIYWDPIRQLLGSSPSQTGTWRSSDSSSSGHLAQNREHTLSVYQDNIKNLKIHISREKYNLNDVKGD